MLDEMKKDGKNAILFVIRCFILLNYVDFSACYLDFAVADREKRVISAHLDVLACEEFRAALPDDNTAWLGDFARIQLDTPVFRIAVSTVSC